jgi:hypothetical protein
LAAERNEADKPAKTVERETTVSPNLSIEKFTLKNSQSGVWIQTILTIFSHLYRKLTSAAHSIFNVNGKLVIEKNNLNYRSLGCSGIFSLLKNSNYHQTVLTNEYSELT